MDNRILVVSIAFVLGGSVFVSPVAGAVGVENTDEPMIHVDVAADGDATVSVVSVYDLDDEDEQAAFESIEEDEEAQDEMRDRFTDRMKSVAENTGADGEAVIADGSVEFRSGDGYGVVTLSVTWNGLAEVEKETLVVTEPFASGFETDRPLTITGPDGSTIESVSPDPAVEDGIQASWDEGTDLDGFELVIALDNGENGSGEEADDSDAGVADRDERAADGLPGFGIASALVALVAVLGISKHRIQY